MIRQPILCGLLATILLPAPAFANGNSVTYSGGKNAAIAPEFAEPMQCIVKKLEERGYNAKEIGCFGERPNNASAHPTAHACDVDQHSRDVTDLNGPVPKEQQTQIAQECQAVSGCQWNNSDCGHFEQQSAPYSPAGTSSGGGAHKYPGYANHPVAKR